MTRSPARPDARRAEVALCGQRRRDRYSASVGRITVVHDRLPSIKRVLCLQLSLIYMMMPARWQQGP